MKKSAMRKMMVALGLAGIMTFSQHLPAFSSTNTASAAAPLILGGVPENVQKVEYAGAAFYLGEGVTEAHLVDVLELMPEPFSWMTSQEDVQYSVHIFWNANKTVLQVHPVIIDYDAALETAAVPDALPASVTQNGIPEAEQPETLKTPTKVKKINVTPLPGMTAEETVEYMLSAEYADAVREEFYKLINEYRAENGLRELEVNPELQKYADIRAAEQRSLFGHVRPDGSAAGSGWFDSENYITTRYAENVLSAGTLSEEAKDTALGCFRWWKNSPGHNAHMLFDFEPHITMAFGIYPEFDEYGLVSSGTVFSTGY
jgi:uncharacterized protein YkwD